MKSAVCLYVRDEARCIEEWIAFQFVIGFDTVIVFDNRSRDGTPRLVRAAGKVRDVRLVPWPLTLKRSQVFAYEACLRLFGHEFDWIAFLDSDEFLVFKPGYALRDLLKANAAASAIAVPFAMFGSSGHIQPPSGLVIESFTRRAPDDLSDHRVVKSIVKPRGARYHTPHSFRTKGPYVLASGLPVDWADNGVVRDPPGYEVCQLNHYFTRSRVQWDEKMRRGYRDITRPENDFERYDHGEVLDESALRFAPAVRREMAAYG
jgi:glycosyltransferase involved in cell wall biosynthesis